MAGTIMELRGFDKRASGELRRKMGAIIVEEGPVTNSVAVLGTNNQVMVSSPAGIYFYRLRHP
jgi:hypothetical protein